MVLDDEETKDDVEKVSLQRRRRKVRAPTVHTEETERLFQKSDLAEIADSPFRALVDSRSEG